MKCNREFIIAYNRLFAFLNDHYSPDKTHEFWNLLSDAICGQLVEAAAQKGIRGCAEYWMDTLSSEGADVILSYWHSGGEEGLDISISKCPSYEKLNDAGQEIAPNYCGHCLAIYAKALQKAGLTFTCNTNDKGRCFIQVRKA